MVLIKLIGKRYQPAMFAVIVLNIDQNQLQRERTAMKIFLLYRQVQSQNIRLEVAILVNDFELES